MWLGASSPVHCELVVGRSLQYSMQVSSLTRVSQMLVMMGQVKVSMGLLW